MLAKVPYIATLLTGTKYQLEDKVFWSRKSKSLSYYVNQLIKILYSQAGISPTIKPSLQYLPALSLTQTEYSHLFFNHVIPRAAESVTNSFNGYSTNNDATCKILHNVFRKICQCEYRAKDAAASNLRDATESTQSSLKSIHVYRSSFELAVHGITMGFGTLQLSLLQRIITWNGIFLCDTWDSITVEWLIDEAHSVAILIHESVEMDAFTVKTPCLRTWLNMVDYCLYWCENANVLMGLKFERGNKITKNKLVSSTGVPIDIKLKNLVTHNRLVKDIHAQALNAHVHLTHSPRMSQMQMGLNNDDVDSGDEILDDDGFVGLGHGIRKIIQNLPKTVLPTQKLFMYSTKIHNNTIQFVDVSDTDYDCPFINHSVPRYIIRRAWINFINYQNGISYGLSAEGAHADQVYQWMHCIVTNVFCCNNNCESVVMDMLNALIAGDVVIARLAGISTFYRTWSDSVIKSDDTVYTRSKNDGDGLYLVKLLLKMNGLKQFATKYNYIINDAFDDKLDCVIVACCNIWECKYLKHKDRFNYQVYKFHDTPVIFLQHIQKVINVKNIVQQCYIAHDHIIPSQQDQSGLKRLIPSWPQHENAHWSTHRANHNEEAHSNSCILPFCGAGWKCREHQRLNCALCLNETNNNKGNIVYECVEKKWPYYKAYTIWQGYVNRLFNARCINETGW